MGKLNSLRKVVALRNRVDDKSVFNPELRIGFVKGEKSEDYVYIDKEYAGFLQITKDSGGDDPVYAKNGIYITLTQDEAEFLYQTLKKLHRYFYKLPKTDDYSYNP